MLIRMKSKLSTTTTTTTTAPHTNVTEPRGWSHLECATEIECVTKIKRRPLPNADKLRVACRPAICWSLHKLTPASAETNNKFLGSWIPINVLLHKRWPFSVLVCSLTHGVPLTDVNHVTVCHVSANACPRESSRNDNNKNCLPVNALYSDWLV